MLKNGKWNFQIQIVSEIKLELVDSLITDDVKKGELHIPSFQNRDDKIYILCNITILWNNKVNCTEWQYWIILNNSWSSEDNPFAQPAFICPKLTIETLEQGVKYVQS